MPMSEPVFGFEPRQNLGVLGLPALPNAFVPSFDADTRLGFDIAVVTLQNLIWSFCHALFLSLLRQGFRLVAD